MFALQVANLKGTGGVYTSLVHYHEMFSSAGGHSVCLYRGPSAQRLIDKGLDLELTSSLISSPLLRLTPEFSRVRHAVRRRAGGCDPRVAMVHSDTALRNIRALFPSTVIATRCHTDKTDRKSQSDIVVTLNADQHRRVAEKLRNTPTKVVLLGHPFADAGRPDAPFGRTPRLNYCARFVSEKDPFTLIQALSRLKTRPFPEVRFLGSGPLEQSVKAAAVATGMGITFPGWKPSPLEDFTSADILVLPSLWEGLPWLLLEALWRGIPVVASAIPGHTDALDDGRLGRLFVAGDPISLANAIDNVFSEPEKTKMFCEMAKLEFSSRHGAAKFQKHFFEVVDSVRKPGFERFK